MSAFAYLRHPITLLAAVTLAIGFIWYVLGLPAQMPASPFAAGEKLGCVAYSPEIDADGIAEVPLARIEADLTRLVPHTSCVRTYRTGAGLDRVPEIAARLGLNVLQGVSLNRNLQENRAEIERAVALSRTQRPSIRALVVGTEVLSRHQMRPSVLVSAVREIRDATKLPVTSAEIPETWLDADLLAASVDFIMLRVPLYDAEHPLSAGNTTGRIVAARAAVAAAFPKRSITVVEAGWPSAGRMRGAALPSPANQARVLHDTASVSKRDKFQFVVMEGIDHPARAVAEGTAGAHRGLIEDGATAPKFNWGGTVRNQPLWFTQGALGVLFAFVVFAAAFLSARSAGLKTVDRMEWEPVAIIALVAGTTIGWAVAELPAQIHSIANTTLSFAQVLLAMIIPPICAAAAVRATPLDGFAVMLNPLARNSARPLSRVLAALFTLFALSALALGLMLALDPAGRDFPFASLTAPAVAFLVLAAAVPSASRREGVAERSAALVLAASALLIVFNESFWNWQALWAAAALGAFAIACWRIAGGQRR